MNSRRNFKENAEQTDRLKYSVELHVRQLLSKPKQSVKPVSKRQKEFLSSATALGVILLQEPPLNKKCLKPKHYLPKSITSNVKIPTLEG